MLYVCEELEASRIRVFLKQTQCHLVKKNVILKFSESIQNRWRENRDALIFFSHPYYKLSSKYHPLYWTEQRNSYRFGTTWGWVNDRIFIFVWTIPLRFGTTIPSLFQYNTKSIGRMSLDSKCHSFWIQSSWPQKIQWTVAAHSASNLNTYKQTLWCLGNLIVSINIHTLMRKWHLSRHLCTSRLKEVSAQHKSCNFQENSLVSEEALCQQRLFMHKDVWLSKWRQPQGCNFLPLRSCYKTFS